MENYDAIIIGASTENPFFLTNAIRSRSFYMNLKLLKKEMNKILNIALKDIDINIQKMP